METSAKRPDPLNLREELERRVYERLDLSRTVDDQEVHRIIGEVIEEAAKETPIPVRERIAYERVVFHSIRGLDVLSDLLKDDSISEIMVNSPDKIFIEQNGVISLSNKQFPSVTKMENVIQQIVAQVNRRVNESMPIADARLPDGSRVNIVLPPVALRNPVITIRKFPQQPFTMPDLVQKEMLSDTWAAYLREMVLQRKNMFISGGTGTGKTTFLNVLSRYIPEAERVITIEDSAELQLKSVRNLISLEARGANLEGENEITIRQLIRTALRMRPDRIIVGEVRGDEVVDMLQAMNTGHDGSLSTGHGNSAEDMLYRLEMMVMMGMDIPLRAVRHQIASAIDVLIHLGRDTNGKRRVLTIHELKGVKEDHYQLEERYRFREEKEQSGKSQPPFLL